MHMIHKSLETIAREHDLNTETACLRICTADQVIQTLNINKQYFQIRSYNYMILLGRKVQHTTGAQKNNRKIF